ncbi:MAG: hypothetical protein ACRD59_17655 [Candidatus Acidiferrales bacterium]
MGKKIILAGLAGGVLVFIVSGLLHSTTKLGEVGIRGIPNEDAVMLAMRNSMPEPGIYLFPVPNLATMSKEQRATEESRYLAKFKQGPTGIVVYKPGGEDIVFGKLLVNQFLIGLVAALMIAWILAATASATSYGTRIMIVIAIGLFAEIYIDMPYWNWYGFPMNYTIGHLLGGVLSWAIAALAMAAIVKQPAAT